MKKLEIKRKDLILILLYIITIITCMYSSLTYGRTVINSDSAIYNTFVEAVWKYHTLFPKTWNYANGDVWTFSNPLVFLNILIYPFVDLSDLSRVFISSLLPLIASVFFIMLFKKGLKDNAWVIALPIAFLFLYGARLYLLYDACYVTYYIWEPITIYCLINVWKNRNEKIINRYSISLAIIFLFLSVHGLRMTADYIVPALLTLLYFLYLEYNNDVRLSIKKGIQKLLFFVSINIIPMIIGISGYKYISNTRNINDTTSGFLIFPESLNALSDSVRTSIIYYFRCFGFIPKAGIITIEGMRNFVSIFFVILLCLVIPILQIRKIKDESEEVQIFVAYVLIHNVVLFVFSIVCGSIINFYHMIPSILLFIFLSSRYIYQYCIIEGGRIRSIVWIMLFAITVFIECTGTLKLSTNWKAVLDDRKYLTNVLVEKGLTKGYATFWNAYATQMYSGNKIKMAAIGFEERALAEYWWLNDSEDYASQATKSFIMLTSEEMENISNEDLIMRGYEEPIEEFVIKDVSLYHLQKGYFQDDVYVYVYADDYGQYMVNGSDDGIVIPREMMFNDVGVRSEDAIILSKDGLIFGPYSTLKAGNYEVEYCGTGLSNASIEIMSEKDDAGVITYSVESVSDKSIKIELVVKSRIEAVQFRLTNPTEKEVAIKDILVTKK